MKKIILLLIPVFCAFGIAATYNFVMPDVELIVHVRDNKGEPVPNANVGASFPHVYGMGGPYKGEEKKGLTNSKGSISLKAKAADPVGFNVIKAGFYKTQGQEADFISLMQQGKLTIIKRDVIIKNIINPVPLYANYFEFKTNIINAPVGFDLVEHDWLPPQGKGQTADIYFNANGTYVDSSNYDSALDITFPNPGDGIQVFSGSERVGSELISDYEAPEIGYLDHLKFTKISKTGQIRDKSMDEPPEGENYYIRTRTVLDKNGKIISANYGKIYGKFILGGPGLKGAFIKTQYYYFNPVANDRNLEFDRKRNLFKNIDYSNRITLP